MTFFSSVISNVLVCQDFNNHHMTIILPSLMKALTSDLIDFKAAGYIVAGQLVASNQITKDLLNKLLDIIINVIFNLFIRV